MKRDQGLIFDIGVNKGEDSEFYLAKGFRVVGLEANPKLIDAARILLAPQIAAGRYTLLHTGLWSERTVLPFYINLTNDHWSSFDPTYGCRDGTQFEVISIPTITIADVIAEHGMPRYMKIDVEGADRIILRDLRAFNLPPLFASVEEYGVEAIHDLYAVGYRRFAIVPQYAKRLHKPPKPALEGKYAERTFSIFDTGLFGLELPERWMDYQEAVAAFLDGVRRADHVYVGPNGEWFDVHAALPEALNRFSALKSVRSLVQRLASWLPSAIRAR